MYYTFFNAGYSAPSGVNNWIAAKPTNGQTSYGTAKNDQLADGTGSNTLSGGAGDDVYLIASSGTKIIESATSGIDTVTAYTNYALPTFIEYGKVQADLVTMVASSTGSQLQSYGSRNVLVSNVGNDILIDESSNKQTLFQFDAGSGKDVIYKFTATGENHDLIRLNYSQFDDFADVKAAMTQVGADVRLTLSANDSILIRNVQLADLTADDFLLPFSPAGLKMTFSDEFNSLSLYNATTKAGVWKTTYTYGPSDGYGSLNARTLPGNGEKEIYVDPTYAGDPTKSKSALGLNPFGIDNGILSITATKLSDALSDKLFGYDYSSGLLTTEKTFAQTYGYFEMRAELPIEKGMFPAFWMLPTSRTWPPEIDIMENIGQNWTSGGSIAPDDRDAFRTYFPDGLKGMHTYGLKWTKETITWYVDGKAVGSVPTPDSMHQPMYLLVNLAVGGDWAGNPDPNFTSAAMKVDYVRAYSLDQATNPAPAPAPAPVPSTDAPAAGDGLLSGITATLNATLTTLTLTGTAAINGTGNTLANILNGNDAANKLWGLAGNDKLAGNGGKDTLYGGAGNDTLEGGAGDDQLLGEDGNDVLNGGAGADLMTGGAGDDFYFVDNVGDKVIEAVGGGIDTVYSSIAHVAAANVENLTLTGTADINGTGNALANKLVGNAGANQLLGGNGNDILDGSGGNDTLLGGSGHDTIIGGAGNDRLIGETGSDILTGGAGVDTFVFGSAFGSDRVTDFGAGGEKDVIDMSFWFNQGIDAKLMQTSVGTVISVQGGYNVTLEGIDMADLLKTNSGFIYDGI